MDLAELFVEITGLCPHSHALFFIKHVDIIRHKNGLPKLNNFQGNHQRNGHKVRENQDPSPQHFENFEKGSLFIFLYLQIVGVAAPPVFVEAALSFVSFCHVQVLPEPIITKDTTN